jgi:predicted DNA-binding transcriptional regulator YafY
MNRTDRLVAMVMFLQGRRLVRAAELAAHFEVTERTIYRDMAALGEAGVPIAGEAGVGYSLLKGYHLPPVMFTRDEAAALFVGGELVKQFTDASLHDPMTQALDKLRAVLPREHQDEVDRLVRQTVVVGRPGSAAGASGSQPMLLPVQQGVVQRRVLRMTYHGSARDSETVRDVEPMGVVYYGGNWTLVAWCRLRMDLRHFRIDRIRRLELRSETFPPRPDFSLRKHLEEQGKPRATIPARIWIAREVQERARRESYATLIEEQSRDGGTEFSLYTFSLQWLARWLLSFGANAEALAPAELRKLVREEAEQVAVRHSPRREKRS